MTTLRAFVGHSFEADDIPIVRQFLDFFNSLKKTPMDFSWDHAQAAEPRLLAEKVMNLMAGKNVFIGICTRREMVISPKNAFNFIPGLFWTPRSNGIWKTSDWVIQEIGLAKGLQLHLILLVEDGVRSPGGLQGDVEYIKFHRDSPSTAFSKIIEMLSALSPKPSTSITGSAHTDLPEVAARKEGKKPDNNWSTPQSEWSRDKFELAFARMIIRADKEGAETISRAYLASDEAGRADNRLTWEADCELARIVWGKDGSLDRLRGLAAEHPDSAGTLQALATGLTHYEEHSQAAAVYETAAKVAITGLEQVRLLGRAAIEHSRAGSTGKSATLVRQMKEIAEKNGQGGRILLTMLRQLSELEEEGGVLMIGILERIVELDPGDAESRFALAFKLSEMGMNDLSLLHYLRIPDQERSEVAWNNLGVAFDRLSLPSKAVDAWLASRRMGGTLAASNLASKLITVGFIGEAKKHCDEAVKEPSHDKHVERTIARLSEVPTEEGEKLDMLLRKARHRSDFYRQFGRALSRRDLSGLAVVWEGPECTLRVVLSDGKFAARGEYKRPANPSLGLLLLGAPAAGGGRERVYDVSYMGTVKGHAIVADVVHQERGAVPSTNTLLNDAGKTEVLMFSTDDGCEIRVLENPQAGEPRLYSLKRTNGAACPAAPS